MSRKIHVLFFVVSLIVGQACFADYFVIVNSANTNIVISKAELNNFFLGTETRWQSGDRVRPAMLRVPTVEMDSFFTSILNMSSKKFTGYWRRKLFAGRGTPPKKLKTNAHLVEFVSGNKNAIAIVTEKPSSTQVSIVSIQ